MNPPPTVGRIVHYLVNNVVTAAIITAVNPDVPSLVSLTVFPKNDAPYPADEVDFADPCRDGHWSWPPRV